MRTPLLLAATAFALAPAASSQWINEFHYDNAGADAGEFVEIAIPSGDAIGNYAVQLYNGSASQRNVYGTISSFTEGATENGVTLYTGTFAGIQNGAPDGLALVRSGSLVPGQFLSYEGAFDAVNGAAVGQMSTDIGVSEPDTTPVGQSLQLMGSGDAYADFAWSGPAAESPGAVNAGQTIASGGGMMPTLTVQPPSASANEGDTTRVPVTLTTADGNPTADPIAFTVTQIGGDATNADYAPYSAFGQSFDGNLPATFFIPAGVASGETVLIPIPLEDDAIVEGTETVVIQLTSMQATFTNDTFSLTINDNDDVPFSVELDYGTCPDPTANPLNPARVPAGGIRCRVDAVGTNNLDVGQRFTVFFRLDGAGGYSQIIFRGETKPEAGEVQVFPVQIRIPASAPAGPLTLTAVVDTGSQAAPTGSAQELDSLTFLKASASPTPMSKPGKVLKPVNR